MSRNIVLTSLPFAAEALMLNVAGGCCDMPPIGPGIPISPHSLTLSVNPDNILISGGNVSNTVGANNTFTNANLVNSTATTKVFSDNSTAIATTAYVNSVLPRGMIMMWNSTYASIPAGWQLCDGSNGTPNLQGQFIVGASATGGYTAGATGGTGSVTLTTGNLPSHTHFASLSGTTDQGGAHNHTVIDPTHNHVQAPNSNTSTFGGGGGGGGGSRGGYGETAFSPTGITLAQSATHNHTLTLSGNVSPAGAGQSFSTLPPYYALCYIQKMY